jgi:hypothetical protein
VGEEAERDTTGQGNAADDGHRRHRRRGEVGLGLGFSLCCALRRLEVFIKSWKLHEQVDSHRRTLSAPVVRIGV